MTDVQTQYATTEDGVSIAYAVIGSGPPLIFNGIGFGDLNMHLNGIGFDPAAYALAGRSVVLYDGRGQGASDRNVLDFSLDARLRDVEAVVAATGLQEFDLLGSVHGAPLAIAYSTRHPEQVRRLILSSGFARGADYYTATPYTRGVRFIAGMAAEDWEFFCLTTAHWVVGFGNSDIAHKVAAVTQRAMSPGGYVKLVEACEVIDVTDLLPSVTAPTLVVLDRSSQFASVLDISKPLAARIPGARLVTVSSPEERAEVVLRFLEPDGAPPPRGEPSRRSEVVTVLFTDVVGHTEMMRRLGDAKGREVLREHEQITREGLAKHSGTEVKTMGDGFMASFGSVTKAVECAVALQKAFEERNAGVGAQSLAPLQVRCGLNAGEPIEDDGDLFGSSVILASRIAAKAQGGEILASMAVRELCAGKGFLFADRGEFVAKGFEEPVRVYEVRWRE